MIANNKIKDLISLSLILLMVSCTNEAINNSQTEKQELNNIEPKSKQTINSKKESVVNEFENSGRQKEQITDNHLMTVKSATITDSLLSFQQPLLDVYTPLSCDLGDICAGSSTNLHSGVDLMARPTSSNTSTKAFSVNFGILRRDINYYDNVGCGSLSCNMGNIVVLEHLLTTGEKKLSLHAHLASKALTGFSINSPIAKNQLIGIVGCSGTTQEAWCTSGGGNRHDHFEIKKPDLGTMDLWPYGYMNQTEANQLRVTGDPTNLPVLTALNRAFSSISTLQSQNARILIPYFSRTTNVPNNGNYDVYGIAGSTLYSSLPLTPATQTTFTHVGIGGRNYSTNAITDSFICSTATLTTNSTPLTRSNGSCNQPIGNTSFPTGDYKFFAYSSEFDSGYPIKFSILPANSEIIDNDGQLVDTTGNTTTSNRRGYFVSSEGGGLDTSGYFLTAKLFTAGSTNWARWFPLNSDTYEVWVHVPQAATASSVKYKIYPQGPSSDGTCSASNSINPCYETDIINHLHNQNTWVRLTAAGKTQFSFVSSSTNSAYVGLAGALISGGNGGVDAVKFISKGGGVSSDITEMYDTWMGNGGIISAQATLRPNVKNDEEYPYAITSDVTQTVLNKTKQVGFFQWQISSSCNKLKIDYEGTNKKANITVGNWDTRDKDLTFENIGLPFVIDNTNTNFNFSTGKWLLVAVGIEPMQNQQIRVKADCVSTSTNTYTPLAKTGKKIIVDGHQWQGNGNIISRAYRDYASTVNQSQDYEWPYGAFRDVMMVRKNQYKPVIFYQWMHSDKCNQIKIDAPGLPSSDKSVTIGKKVWSGNTYNTYTTQLPATIDKENIWTVIQVAFNQPVSNDARLEASCTGYGF